MFEKLKRKSLQKLTDRYLALRDFSQVNEPVKTVGFLVDEALFQEFDELFDFSKDLKIPPKNVKVFSFIRVKKKLPTLEFNQVQSKDFNWKGELHNPNANEFLNTPFDVLVGCYQDDNEFLNVMMAQSKAKFKVGFTGMDERLCDLLITTSALDTTLWKVELKKYLTILGKL